MSSSRLPTICSFWFGPLSWLERLCIASFVRHGHAFELYSYDEPEHMPAGSTWRDAAQIVPRDEMFFYKGNRSPAVFADYFRLLLMQAEAGIWADCDMMCVRPFAGLGGHVFGHEVDVGRGAHAGQINNAVLRLPKDSPLLQELLALFEGDTETVDPVWMPWYRRTEIAIRRALGQKVGLTHMQFGATGPFPVTYFARRLKLDDKALPRKTFYPLPYTAAARMLEPESAFEPYISPETLGVHLWRMALTDRGRDAQPHPPAPGSALARAAKDLGVRIP